MLPLYGLAVVSGQEGNGAGFVALTIVVAQAVMIVASIAAMRMAEKEAIGWSAHIVYRAARSRVDRGIGDQILGGVSGAGARRHRRGLAKRGGPGLVARILNGTGRVMSAKVP